MVLDYALPSAFAGLPAKRLAAGERCGEIVVINAELAGVKQCLGDDNALALP